MVQNLGLEMRIIMNENCNRELKVVNEIDGATFLIDLTLNITDNKNA